MVVRAIEIVNSSGTTETITMHSDRFKLHVQRLLTITITASGFTGSSSSTVVSSSIGAALESAWDTVFYNDSPGLSSPQR